MVRRPLQLVLAAGLCGTLIWGLRAPIHRVVVLEPAMQRAVGQQDLQAIRRLALQGADARMRVIADGGANVGPHPPNSPLWVAVAHGDVELVRILIQRGADPSEFRASSTRPEYRESLLMRAAALGLSEVVEALLEGGAPVNASNREGATALVWAVSHGTPTMATQCLEVINTLLRHAADPHVTARDLTALAIAEDRGLDVVARRLRATRSAGFDECMDRIAAQGPIHAVGSGRMEPVKRLVDRRVSFGVRDSDYTTVMLAAAIDPDEIMLPYLLKHARGLDRAFLNERSRRGNALSIATAAGNWRCAKLLLAAGVDPDVPCISGRMPLHAAVIEGRADIISLLLKAGASVNSQDMDGRTPQDFVGRNRSEVSSLLMQAGVK
jgi:ankyrin repeat protein